MQIVPANGRRSPTAMVRQSATLDMDHAIAAVDQSLIVGHRHTRPPSFVNHMRQQRSRLKRPHRIETRCRLIAKDQARLDLAFDRARSLREAERDWLQETVSRLETR